jgi:hypothetical protein
MMFVTYGYMQITAYTNNIHNFINQYKTEIDSLKRLNDGDTIFTNFEYDEQKRVVLPFTIFGENITIRNDKYIRFYNTLKVFFPDMKELVKVNVKINNEGDQFFNDEVKDYFQEGEE